MALDCKINSDENALYRHPELSELRDETEEDPTELKAAGYGLNFIKLDGNVGCMVNGAGLAMGTMDIIKHYGGEPPTSWTWVEQLTLIELLKLSKSLHLIQM